MPLSAAEIRPGVVAYLNAASLNIDPAVSRPQSPTPRNGPFLCFAVNGSNTGWTPISNQVRAERLLIEPAWRLGGGDAWQHTDQYLNDGATTYIGPKASFVTAAATTDKYNAQGRPRVSAAGVAAVLQEVQAQGGAAP
jgi:hypothetical protein